MKEKAKAFEGRVCRLKALRDFMTAILGNSSNIWGCFLCDHIQVSFKSHDVALLIDQFIINQKTLWQKSVCSRQF